MQEFLEGLLGTRVFSKANDDVIDCEVLVPRGIENAVGSSENPLIADQTGSTQQLLRATLIQHHLPAIHTKHNHQQKAFNQFPEHLHLLFLTDRTLPYPIQTSETLATFKRQNS